MQEFMPSAIEFAQKHTLLTIAWIAIFCMVVYSFIQAASRKFRIISQAEMVCLINNDEAAVIDLRSLDLLKLKVGILEKSNIIKKLRLF